MGLGLSFKTSLAKLGGKERGLLGALGLQRGVDHPLAALEAEARAFASESPAPLCDWYSASVGRESATITLFPSEEPIELSVAETFVVCSAKTSTAGPGYHAHVVSLFDRWQQKLGAAWIPAEDGEPGDEAGYFVERDFDALQVAMTHWLRGLSKMLMEDRFEEVANLSIGMPMNGPRPETNAFATSTMGEWPRSFFARIASGDDEVCEREASRFFPWWDEGVTRENLHAFALCRAWLDLRWIGGGPDDEPDEWQLASQVVSAYQRGVSRDPATSALPELDALASALRTPAEPRVPLETGIGFRRRAMIHVLPGGWTVSAPGYFSRLDEDDGTTVLYFIDRTIRVSSFRFDGDPPLSPEALLQSMEELAGAERLELAKPHLSARMKRYYSDEESCHVVEAHVAKAGGLCFVSIYYEDAADAGWACAVAASITCPPAAD
jgi:hypothetical protein